MKEERYYTARGFSVYYMANVIFNVVATPMSFLRNIEDIMGDLKTEFLMRPFKGNSNLHEFIRCVSIDIICEDIECGG